MLTMLAIGCGSLAAGLFYKSYQTPKAQLSESQAKSLGYASAADQRQTTEEFNKYWPDIVGNGRLTESEYNLATKAMSQGSPAAKMRIIIVFGYLRGDSERKRALALLPRETIDTPTYGLWRSSFHRWMSGPKDQSVFQLLTASGNPNAIKIAEELRRAGDA